MRYPTNHSIREESVQDERGAGGTIFLSVTLRHNINIPTTFNVFANTAPGVPGSGVFPVFSGLSNTLPSPPFASTASYTSVVGSFSVAAGNLTRYIVDPTDPRAVLLQNQTSGQTIRVGGPVGTRIGETTNDATAFVLTSDAGGPNVVVNTLFSTLTLPPITQDDMLQQNPKMVAQLAKETDGVYIPSSIFEPIFNVTSAAEYRKVLLITKADVTSDMISPFLGWFDTYDTNFSTTVVNFQGIPYACKPMVKICRGVELVPSSNSILGIFAQGSPDEQPEAIDICKAFTQYQPHGYPVNYNGLGILFGKVMKVVDCLPVLLRNGLNIYRGIKSVCDEDLKESSHDSDEYMYARNSLGHKLIRNRYR